MEDTGGRSRVGSPDIEMSLHKVTKLQNRCLIEQTPREDDARNESQFTRIGP